MKERDCVDSSRKYTLIEMMVRLFLIEEEFLLDWTEGRRKGPLKEVKENEDLMVL